MALDTYKLTVAQFWEQYAGQNYELIDGKVMEMAPAGIRASAIARRIAARLGDFVDANNLGEVTAADGGSMLCKWCPVSMGRLPRNAQSDSASTQWQFPNAG